MLNQTAGLGEELCRTTSSRGQAVVHKEVSALRDDWKSFSSALADVERNMEACIGNWNELGDLQQAFQAWMERMDARLREGLETQANLARKRTQLQEGEVPGIVRNMWCIDTRWSMK